MTRTLALALALLGLAACSTPTKSNFDQSVVSLAAGYTIAKVEKRYDVECSVFNILESGEYCVHKYKPTDRQEVHCFKTLGGVDCYGERDPYMLAGRSLPTAPRHLADPAMPMDPPPNQLNKIVEKFDPDARREREAEAQRAAQREEAERQAREKVPPADPSPSNLRVQ